MAAETPEQKYSYRSPIMDSTRWEGFAHRAGDVLVCTSYKAGTTWMQMICGLVIFQRTDFTAPLSEISPWLDRRGVDKQSIHDRYAEQGHRRFIKTHTPLDALPWREDSLYFFVGRAPRDVFWSTLNHTANGNPEFIEKLLDGDASMGDKPELPSDPNVRFQLWLDTPTVEWEQDGFPYWSHLRHALTFWQHRHLPNIHFFHYNDMQENLDREMRRVARILEIEIDETIWPELVRAATFDSMKARADELAPDASEGAWKNNASFFNQGRDGQWRGKLSEENLARYDRAIAERLPPDLAEFLEHGASARDPKAD